MEMQTVQFDLRNTKVSALTSKLLNANILTFKVEFIALLSKYHSQYTGEGHSVPSVSSAHNSNRYNLNILMAVFWMLLNLEIP